MSRRHIGIAATLVAGTALGLVLALPVQDIAGKCPPDHEGLTKCIVDRQVLPSVAKLLIGICLAFAALEIARAVPEYYRRWRAGELFGRLVGEDPPWESDPVLVASVWGETYDDAAGAAGGVHRTKLVHKLRERHESKRPRITEEPVPVPERIPSERVAAVALLLQEVGSLHAATGGRQSAQSAGRDARRAIQPRS